MFKHGVLAVASLMITGTGSAQTTPNWNVSGAKKPEPIVQRFQSQATVTHGAVGSGALTIVKGTPFAAEVGGLLEDLGKLGRLTSAHEGIHVGRTVDGRGTSMSVQRGDERGHITNHPDFSWVTSESGGKMFGQYDLDETAQRREVQLGLAELRNGTYSTSTPHLETMMKEPDGRLVRRSYWKLPDGSLVVNSFKTELASGLQGLLSKPYLLGKNAEGQVLKKHWQTHLVRNGKPIRIPNWLGRRMLDRAQRTSLKAGR